MGKDLQNTMREYLKYFASHLIIISDYLKDNEIKDGDVKIMTQHFDEMSENLQQIITILDKYDIYNGLEGEDPVKIIRDFKISKIMNEGNR